MASKYPILRSLDPYQQRLGYLNCVALVAGRDLDRRDALSARLQDLIFERIYKEDPKWSQWCAQATPAGQAAIYEAMKNSTENDPASILQRNPQNAGWVFAQDLWLNDKDMPSSVGAISSEAIATDEAKLSRPIELAKWLELILPTYELSENGVIVRSLLEEYRIRFQDSFNPFLVYGFYPLQLMYLRMLLAAECLFPALLQELVSNADAGVLNTSGERGLLLMAVKRVVEIAGEPSDPSDILELQELLEFRDSVLKSNSTAENYLRPRLEILVDLGLVSRQNRKSGFVWKVTETTRRCANAWQPLAMRSQDVGEYLGKSFFHSMADIYARPNVPMTDPKEILATFASAFGRLGREFGFTPGRTVATAACIDAWMNNRALEVDTVFDTVYAAAKTDMGKYLQFSGGSRFDREFLIKVSPHLLEVLRK